MLTSIKKNYTFNALFTLINIAYPLLTLAYVARIIGPEYLGKYYFANSLTTYFLFAASFGIPIYGTREIAKHRADPEALGTVFSELAWLNLLSSFGAGAAMAAVVAALPAFREDWLLFLILGAAVPLNVLCLDFLFYGLEDQGNIAARVAASKALSLAVLFLTVRTAEDYMIYAALITGSLLLQNLMALPSAARRVRLRRNGLRPGRHLRPLAYLLLTSLAVNVYLNLDNVMLGMLAGHESVGYYNAGMRLCRNAVILVTAVGMSVIPRISYHLHGGREAEYLALLRKSSGLILLAALPAMLMLGLCAPGLIAALFGPGFGPGTRALEIAAPLVLLSGLSHFLGMQVLFPRGDEKQVFRSALAAAAVSLGLNFLLASRWRQEGAAAAAVAAEATALAILWFQARRRHRIGLMLGRDSAPYFLAAAAMAAILLGYRWTGKDGIWPLTAALATASLAYVGLLYALGEFHIRNLADALARRLRAG